MHSSLFYDLDYITEVLNENPEEDPRQHQAEEWEGGLTFIAKSSRKYISLKNAKSFPGFFPTQKKVFLILKVFPKMT